MVNPISGSGAKQLRPPHVIQLVLMSASALAMLWLIGGFPRAVGCWVAAFAVLVSCCYLACRSVARLIAAPMAGVEAWREAVVGLCCLVAISLAVVDADQPANVAYLRDLRPVFEAYCAKCLAERLSSSLLMIVLTGLLALSLGTTGTTSAAIAWIDSLAVIAALTAIQLSPFLRGRPSVTGVLRAMLRPGALSREYTERCRAFLASHPRPVLLDGDYVADGPSSE